MAVTGTYTANELVTDAFRKIGVVGEGDPMNGDQSLAGVRALNRMLKAWQNRGWLSWAVAEMTVTLTTAASYALTPARPVRILSARLRRNGIDTPMQELTREEYDTLPVKTSTGLPTTFYYDRQREAGTLYVWPVLAVAAGETLRITYERELEDMTDGSVVSDVPGEWWDAVVYGLAARLADDYGRPDNVRVRMQMMADAEMRQALSADREGSVWFSDAR